jgi:hypothetical protein
VQKEKSGRDDFHVVPLISVPSVSFHIELAHDMDGRDWDDVEVITTVFVFPFDTFFMAS